MGFCSDDNKLHEELTFQELVSLTREEKDAMNATMIGMNNIGLLATRSPIHRSSRGFCGYYVRIFGPRWRRAVEVHAKAMMQEPESASAVWNGLYWLMENLEEAPDSD